MNSVTSIIFKLIVCLTGILLMYYIFSLKKILLDVKKLYFDFIQKIKILELKLNNIENFLQEESRITLNQNSCLRKNNLENNEQDKIQNNSTNKENKAKSKSIFLEKFPNDKKT